MIFLVWLIIFEVSLSWPVQQLLPTPESYALCLLAVIVGGGAMAVAAVNDGRGNNQAAYLHTVAFLVGVTIFFASLTRYVLSLPDGLWGTPTILGDMVAVTLLLILPATVAFYPMLTLGLSEWRRRRNAG